MTNSGFTQAEVSHLTVAAGHSDGEAGLEPNDPWAITPAFNPAGGLLSTVDDMLKFVAFHAGITTPTPAPVDDEGRLEMQRVQGPGGSLGPIRAESMGLGWMLTGAGDHRVAMSFGSDSGAAAGMAVVAERDFGVVVLANSDPGLQLATECISKAMDIYFHSPLPSAPRIALAQEERDALVGTYAIPNDLAFEISVTGTNVTLVGKAGDEIVPPLTGPLEMLTPTLGQFMVGNMPVLIDFIPDEEGRIGWIRSFARIAPRVR
jgi:CubicO group peptidase (beta-lactamase class C family)